MRSPRVLDADVALDLDSRSAGGQLGAIGGADGGREPRNFAGLQSLQIKPHGIVQVLIHGVECHCCRVIGLQRKHLNDQRIEGSFLVVAFQVVLNHHACPDRAEDSAGDPDCRRVQLIISRSY